jgi:hypothetical protein
MPTLAFHLRQMNIDLVDAVVPVFSPMGGH